MSKLRAEWLSSGGGAFVMLTPLEQWALHEFYRFTDDLTEDQLIVHRKSINSQLPQRAGKAIARLALFINRLEAYRVALHANTRKKGAPYEVRVLSQVNPDIDPKAMAKILIELAKERGREDGAS